MSVESATDLRRRIKREIPSAAFAPRAHRALWFVPLLAIAVAGTRFLSTGAHGVGTSVVTCLVVGNTYASMLLLAHEIMHGAVVRSRKLQNVLAWIGLAPFLISPTLWRVWHNEVHHAHTNEIDRDPDIFAGEAMQSSSATSRFILRFVPGAGGALSAIFPFVWFCAQGQIVLWFLSLRMPGFERLDRARAKHELGVMVIGWLGLAFVVGFDRARIAIIVPMAIGNCMLMSYIATNHLLRPLVKEGDPLRSSMSVRTHALLDRLHFRFSHHVEHHLFPAMSGRDLPRVREWILRHAPEGYVCPSHLRALVWLYRTPRTYRDATTLVDPHRPWRHPVDLEELARGAGVTSHHG